MCVGVMHSGEYDVCDVTLECASTPGKLKSLPDNGGNRTRDLWDASPMLCQLSYAVKSVRVDDISELSLVPSISVYIKYHIKYHILEYTDIERARLSSKISSTRTDLTA